MAPQKPLLHSLELSGHVVIFPGRQREPTMPSIELRLAKRAIAAIRDQDELHPVMTEAPEEIFDAIRVVEARLATLEGKGTSPPTTLNGLHLLDDDGDPARHILPLLE
jgi:hypothetical protein